MDIKHVLSMNPLRPAYAAGPGELRPVAGSGARPAAGGSPTTAAWSTSATTAAGSPSTTSRPATPCTSSPSPLADRAGDLRRVGRVHRRRRLPARPSCGCPRAGRRSSAEGWEAPLYWRPTTERLARLHPRAASATSTPTSRSCHVSYYEADAFARWAGGRLPTEAEWEAVAAGRACPARGVGAASSARSRCTRALPAARRRSSATCGSGRRAPTCPTPASTRRPGRWASTTASSWSNQQVLRGGCCATPAGPRPGHLPQLLPGLRPDGRSAASASPTAEAAARAMSDVTVEVHLTDDDLRGAL